MSTQAQNPPSESYFRADKGWIVETVVAIFAFLELAAVGARMYARKLSKATLGWDDYTIFIALVPCLGLNISAVAMVQLAHMGRHFAAVKMMPNADEVITNWHKFVGPILETQYTIALTAAKFSICLLYLRLFVLRWVKNTVYVIMAVQTAWAVAFMVLAFAQCVPVRKQWHPEIEGTCVDRGAFYGYISLPNIIIDAVMLALPVPVIWKLQLKRNQKWILAPIFLIGSTALIVSSIRASFFLSNNPFVDGTWTSVPLVTCTVVEAGAVLIAACLPLLRPLIKNLYAKHIKPLTRYLSKDGSFPRRSRSSKSEGLGIAGPKSYLNLGSVGRASIENHIYGEDGSRKGQSWRKIQNEVIPLDAIAVRHDITVSSNPP